MGHAWLNITYFSDEEFKAELRAENGARRPPPGRLAASAAGTAVMRDRDEPRFLACVVLCGGAGALLSAGQQGQGQTPESAATVESGSRKRIQRDRGLRGLVPKQGRQR